MTKSSILSAVSRIERAPNMSAVVRAYDAALGGSDVSVHRHQGAWQIWHGEASGFCGDFTEIRTHLARDAEEILERTAEEAAPAMAQPAQLQQACAAPAASAAPQRLSRDEILSRIRAHDRERDEAVAEIERRAVNGKPSRLDTWLLDGIRATGAILGEQLSEHDRVAMENPPAAGFRVVKAWVDDADVFQTVTFPMIFERAQDATAEIVSLLGGRDPAKFSAAEREAGAVLTMEEVGPEPGRPQSPSRPSSSRHARPAPPPRSRSGSAAARSSRSPSCRRTPWPTFRSRSSSVPRSTRAPRPPTRRRRGSRRSARSSTRRSTRTEPPSSG